MERLNRKGVGYSIEAILSAVILFTFAFGAVTPPQAQEFSQFQDEVAARDLTHMIKITGDLNKLLSNSNTGGIRSEISSVSAKNLGVSGTLKNLPVDETRIGFHTMPSETHTNNTELIQSGDRCEGDLTSLDARSEEPIIRADISQELVDRHTAYVYFGDSDPLVPSGYNGQQDYDTLWVDNGTRCVFPPSAGPYNINDIFLWGNTSDSDSRYYEFKNINVSENEFTVYEADNAFDVRETMESELNGIDTDTLVNTVNFSSPDIYEYDIMVFQENETINRFNPYNNLVDEIASNTSMLFMMNMTQADAQNDFIRDVGFKWTPMTYSSISDYRATFSAYGNSDNIESYFLGMGGDPRDISLKPGGQIISNQGSTEASRDDLLYARNVRYSSNQLDGEKDPSSSWSSTSGPFSSCNNREADFSIPGPDYSSRTVPVKNIYVNSSCGLHALKLDVDGSSGYEVGPVLTDEIVEVFGRRYSPSISGPNDATLEFVGSKKVELVNHREGLNNISGEKAARIAYESSYEEDDLKMIASTIYWLREDTSTFEATDEGSYVSTKLVGGIQNQIFLPYRLDLRWSR